MSSHATPSTIRIGTRKSPLALAQAHHVGALIVGHIEAVNAYDILSMDTEGDRNLETPLMELGGKGLFTAEIEEKLLEGAIDIAVHSAKDMPTELPQGLEMTCFLEREDPRDVFISPHYKSIKDLPLGATIGTASLRRKAQLLHIRNDLQVVPFRGNVQTRLRKLEAGEVAGTFLALAGLKRLDMASVATEILDPALIVPAPAQGALGIESASDNEAIKRLLSHINHQETATCVTAERSLLATLDGSCRTPIAALARITTSGELELKARVLSHDGLKMYEATERASADDAIALGNRVGKNLLKQGGKAFFEALRTYSDMKN